MRRNAVLIAPMIVATALSALCVACGGGSSNTPTSPTSTNTPEVATVTKLTVTGPGCANGSCSGQPPSTLQMTATAQLSSGSMQDVTAQAAWSTSNSGIATVSNAGLVTFLAAGDADIVAAYQGKSANLTMHLSPAGPNTSFGAGQYLVNKDIAPGRYFTDPASDCYYERDSGLSGNLSDIISNNFIAFNAAQAIVDISGSDLAFTTKTECGTWNQSPRAGVQSSITPGYWLVNAQVPPGTYSAQASAGCYWERLRSFGGQLGEIFANNFVASGGQQLVTINSGDTGFDSNDSCGTWTRTSTVATDGMRDGTSDPVRIRENWMAHRAAAQR